MIDLSGSNTLLNNWHIIRHKCCSPISDLDRTFIELSTDSHLPVFSSHDEFDILHGTQLVVMDQSGSDLSNIKLAAYVSGKKAIYIVNQLISVYTIYCSHMYLLNLIASLIL